MSRTLNGAARGSARVVEIDPMAMKKVWEYSVAGTESQLTRPVQRAVVPPDRTTFRVPVQ